MQQSNRVEKAAEIAESVEQKDWARVIQEQLQQLTNKVQQEEKVAAMRAFTRHKKELEQEVDSMAMEKEFLLLALYLVKSSGGEAEELEGEIREDLEALESETSWLHEYFTELYRESGVDWIGEIAAELEAAMELGIDDIDPQQALEEWEDATAGERVEPWDTRGPPEGFGLG
ncbi:MAG: hypothetical protein ABEJ64_03185 [Candidatus Nanohaloarchaea archaeon]